MELPPLRGTTFIEHVSGQSVKCLTRQIKAHDGNNSKALMSAALFIFNHATEKIFGYVIHLIQRIT